MFESPRSLTATIYVRFNYKEPETQHLDEKPTEMMGIILDQASGLSTEMQEILVKFADYLSKLGQEKVG